MENKDCLKKHTLSVDARLARFSGSLGDEFWETRRVLKSSARKRNLKGALPHRNSITVDSNNKPRFQRAIFHFRRTAAKAREKLSLIQRCSAS
jgi:hypothetical protein